MPVDYKVLDSYGTTERALRLLFTIPSVGSELTADHKKYIGEQIKKREEDGVAQDTQKEELRYAANMRRLRDKWEKRICSRISEGRLRNFKTYRWHYAADLAWDGPVFADQVPLMLYAQGRIDVTDCAQQLQKTLGKEAAKEYIEFDKDKGIKPVGVNASRLGENVINLVRPYITRRKAALSNQFNDLYPWLNYEPRNRTMAGKIRAAVTTQRIEQVVDSRGMRHDFTQWVHKMLLHTGQWVFVSEPWLVEKASRMNAANKPESYVVSEGPILAHPHPTRTFYDRAHPPSGINYDKGISYCGYWDMVRYRDIKDNPSYFNAANIKYSTDHEEEFRSYRDFFKAYYSDENQIKFVPDRTDPLNSMRNDRQSTSGLYAEDDDDCSIFFSNYYERIIPKDVGAGTYPYPVWVKLTVINDKTVVRARIMPSRPAFYFGHNEDDSRDQNVAMAHEIMPFQDQAQELLGQLYYLLRLEQLLMLAIDTDLIPDKDMRDNIRKYLQGNRARPEAMYMEWSGTKIREVQKTQAKQPFEFIKSSVQPQIKATLEGIGTTMNMLEKILMMSPQELGQFVTKETNATEVTSVNKTTNALYSFIAEGPDEARAALKVILYESLMALGEDSVPTAVVAQFPPESILEAGFEMVEEIKGEREPEAFVVKGLKKAMAHDFIYNSRDGSERSVSVEASKTLYQFVTQIMANQALLQLFGWKQIADMITEVFRLSGSPFVIKMPPNLPEGGPAEQQAGPEMQQALQQFQQQFQQAIQQIDQRFGQLEKTDQEIIGSLQEALDELSKEAEESLVES